MKLYYPEAGMKLHGENACKYHPFEKYDPQKDRDKPTMFWIYFDEDYKTLANHTGKKLICWHGSDVLWFLYGNQRLNIPPFRLKYINLIRDSLITHIFLNYITQGEMSQYGIYGEKRYIFWGDIKKYSSSKNLTKDCFMCCPETKQGQESAGPTYGELIFNSLAWKYPDWTFHIFGITPTVPVYCDNVKYYGWVKEDYMDKLTENFGLCIRYNAHDGFPQVMCKALLREQFVITQLPYDGLTAEFRTPDQLFKAFDAVNLDIEQGHTYRTHVRAMINNFDFLNI